MNAQTDEWKKTKTKQRIENEIKMSGEKKKYVRIITQNNTV